MSARRRRGFVLVIVLVFALLLSASVATLTRRAVVDAMITSNRDRAAEAEALARGGLRLATALLLEDLVRQQAGESLPIEAGEDVWARAPELETESGASLALEIEDAGAHLNLNALFDGGAAQDFAEPYLFDLLERVIDEMPGRPEEKVYDRETLARNLIDYVDADDVGVRGGAEDEPYRRRTPPDGPANRPLLSVDELRRVAGFDAKLVEELRHYVTVFPFTGDAGINLNTAPPHVLGLLRLCEPTSCRLATEDDVRDVLRARQEGPLCDADDPECFRLADVLDGRSVEPPPSTASSVFAVQARARVGGIERTLEAVVDRSEPSEPLLLSWRMR